MIVVKDNEGNKVEVKRKMFEVLSKCIQDIIKRIFEGLSDINIESEKKNIKNVTKDPIKK